MDYLDGFHLSATVNGMSINMVCKYPFESLLSVISGINPEVECQNYMVPQCLMLRETAIPVPKWLHHFTFLPARDNTCYFVCVFVLTNSDPNDC